MSGPGELRHRLVHETPVATPDGLGGAGLAFAVAGELWGAIRTAAAPAEIADRPGAVRTHRVTLRAPAAVTPGDRLRLGARLLLVEAVSDEDGRGRWLTCRCREETP